MQIDELPPNERKHRIIVYIKAEIQEVLRTGENQGIPKHGVKDVINIEGESLDHCKQRLEDFLVVTKRMFNTP